MPEKKTTAARSAGTVKKTAAPRKATASKTTARTKTVAPAAKPAPLKRTVRKRVSAPPRAAQAPASAHGIHRRTKIGTVVSAKQAHTAIVEVERMREHPLYKKAVRVRKKFAAHDDAGDVRAGDIVRIQESRPYSATKRWRVIEVLSRAGEAGAAAPRVADISRQLEESEGSSELLKPVAPVRVATAEPDEEESAE
jgi:small subunit ribosomal protein S17